MRVLFSCVAGDGHFLPLVPLARAFQERGDEVTFAAASSFLGRVEATGFAAAAAGLDHRELEMLFTEDRKLVESLPLAERRAFAFPRRFGRLDAPARIDDLRELARGLRPDVLVHERAEFAAPVVAAQLDLPSVYHGLGRPLPAEIVAGVARETAQMWRDAGLDPEPHAGLFRGASVDICPAGLAPDAPPPATRTFRQRALDVARPAGRTARSLVYVTLGTVVRDAAALRIVLAALGALDVEVLVTTGAQNDPAELGTVPANATIETYLPQSEVLPRCALVVTHAGSGSLLGALAHGLPLLALPHAADQFDNADAARRAGAGLTLLPDEVSVDAVREAVSDLLAAPSYRDAAQAIAAEIAAMPPPAETAGKIEELCRSTT